MNNALATLLRSLAIVGVKQDDIDMVDNKDEGSIDVTVSYFNRNVIRINVGDFWRFPGMTCYFVNFSHPCGDFSSNVGTPYIEQAMVDIGSCMAMFKQPA